MAMKSLIPALAGTLILLTLQAGCRDEIAPPTQGFVQLHWNEATQVQVFVDGEFAGVDVSVVGPIDAGEHTITAVRECYRVEPEGAIQVAVAPAETTSVDFTLTPQEFGSIEVTAIDELTQEPISGAGIFRETSPGVFTATGVTTPGIVSDLPCGTTRFRVQKEGFAESAPTEVTVNTGVQGTASLQLGPINATLLEMFTYVVCPNCPYAADTLEVLHEELPSQAYVIEWHSWQGLPLYDARWKAREIYYTTGGTIGYPASTAGGVLPLLIGAQSSELSEYRARMQSELQQCGGDCPIAMRLTGTIGATSADLTAHVKWRGGALPANLKLRFVLIENEVPAPGNQPRFGFVAREMTEVSLTFATPGELLVLPSSLPIQAWPYSGSPPHYEAIAFIQSDDTKEILQVSGIQ